MYIYMHISIYIYIYITARAKIAPPCRGRRVNILLHHIPKGELIGQPETIQQITLSLECNLIENAPVKNDVKHNNSYSYLKKFAWNPYMDIFP